MRSEYIADKLVRIPERCAGECSCRKRGKTRCKYPHRALSGVRGLSLHQSKGRGNAAQMARFHVLERGWPGIAYTFLIDDNHGPSRIYQTAEIDRATNHSGLHNRSRIGIVIVGDFDRGLPHPNQIHACAWLCAVLCVLLELGDPKHQTGPWLLPGRVVSGHRELWGATRKVGKTCPGSRFDLDAMRETVRTFDVSPLDDLKTRSGIVFPGDTQ